MSGNIILRDQTFWAASQKFRDLGAQELWNTTNLRDELERDEVYFSREQLGEL